MLPLAQQYTDHYRAAAIIRDMQHFCNDFGSLVTLNYDLLNEKHHMERWTNKMR